MKIFLSVAIIGISSFIGFLINKKLVLKRKFYLDFINFLKDLKVDISFFQNNLTSILEKHIKGCRSEFKTVLTGFLKFNNSPGYKTKENLSKYLNLDEFLPEEQDSLLNFFLGLGKSDAVSQSAMIESYIVVFNSYLEKATEKQNTIGKMSLKLGFMFGLFVCVMLI